MSAIAAFVDAIHPAFLDGDPAAHAKEAEADHVRRARELYGAIARGDFAAFGEAFAEHAQLDIAGPPEIPFAGRWEGRERVLEAVRHNFSLLDDQRPVVESVVAQGDTVVVVFDEEGRVRATGRGYRVRVVQMLTFQGGKLAKVRQVAANRS